jgi:pimeloyl-ACP methyl ester carboxylesterase
VNEPRRLRASAGEIAFRDLGDPEAPAVVLIHGFPTSAHLWRHLAPMLAPMLRVLVPDLVGAGDSDKPEDVPLGPSAQAGYLVEWLDALGVERVAAVGHGIGGGIAQLLAVEGRATTMVLVDATAFDAWPSAATREAQAHAPTEDPALVAAVIRTAFEIGTRRGGRRTEADLAEYVRPFAGAAGARALSRWLLSLDGRGLPDEEALGRLEVPTLVLWGEDDPFFPPAVAERLGEALPMATVALLPGCGHFLPEEAPETIGPLVAEYLRSRYLGRPHTHEAGPVRVELGRRPPSGGDRG